MLENIFKLEAKNTTVKTELIAGLTTFLAMAYILGVNPLILKDAGMDIQSVFVATALSSGLASIVMGIVANYPVALAPGMGINALFTYTICGAMGMSWQAALAGVFLSGVLFLVISITGIRKTVINAIPNQLKIAIGAGIGFFIAFIGLKNAGVVVADAATGVALGDLTEPTVLLAVGGILLTIALIAKKVPASVFVGMVVTAIIGIILGYLLGIKGMPELPQTLVETNFNMDLTGAFMGGFTELFADPIQAGIIVFSLLFVGFFDAAGTLVAVATSIGLVKEDGELENVDKALLSDAIGTVTGATLGMSPVVSFVESASGVAVGGRTGLTACTTGVMFFVSVLFAPIILSSVTSAVTAPALVVVGILMAQQLKEIDWDDFVYATAGFITIATMILTYSISNGIAFGFIAYSITMLASGKGKQVHLTVWILNIIFVLYYAIPAFS